LPRRSLLAAWCLGAAVRAPAARAATPGEVPVGQVLRDATMQGLNGPARQLSSFRGRPLVINVWASWCGPCRVEMPSLERLAWGDLGGRFTLIGISTDDHVAAAQAFLQRSNATLSHYIDRQLQLEHMLGAAELPLTVLVDAQGRVLEKVVGARAWDGPEGRRLIERWFPAPPR
jgi:thiol-disulfide isomerase/thioredoxin